MKYITRAIWILSLISLFTDTASEMLYPIMPIYLQSIGFSIVLIGILEGVAEATAGLSKGYFGQLSDHLGKRTPFIRWGYSISAISKPLIALFIHPLWVFVARTLDRVGKGIRTGARDALLSDESTTENKGKVFGFHRSMDTLGAVLGPALALVYLYFYPENYRTLFFIAFIPGILAILVSLLLKERTIPKINHKQRITLFSFVRYWKTSPLAYRKLVGGLLFFTLFNSSDVFLLLKMKQTGMNDTGVIGVYIFYNLVYALFSFPMGILADKIGLKKILLFGLVLFSVVYFGMAFSSGMYLFLFLFLLYGIYAAATEGISKAWISNIVPASETATAIGTFAAFQSICLMIASSLAGVIWYKLGAGIAFLFSGTATLIVLFFFLVFLSDKHLASKG